MIKDVFYYGKKPNVHPREKFAESLAHARTLATTEQFWIINEFCDYRNFDWDWDFEFLHDGDVWAEDHNNVWPSTHQKDSGTWLCPTTFSDVIIYRSDVDPIARKNEESANWALIEEVDKSKFDFSWHPDPTDPPYIYAWGNKWVPVQLQSAIEYRCPGATEVKYMSVVVEVLPETDRWVESQKINTAGFDMSWRPDPREPAYVYIWGNKWIPAEYRSTLEYHCPGATEVKYMPDLISVMPETDRWVDLQPFDKSTFDFTWRPDPREPDFIYQFGTQWGKTGGPRYAMPGATEIKYLDFAAVVALPSLKNWDIPEFIDTSTFDLSWHPDATEEAYIYEFGTQWQKTGGPRYVVPGGTEIKYVDVQKARILFSSMLHWEVPDKIDTSTFDFSWHPDSTDAPYTYCFSSQWSLSGGPKYIAPGSTDVKYVSAQTVRALPNPVNWEVPSYIDADKFDFSWHPYAEDEPYIYQFGTQWQKTGGPRYITPGTKIDSPIKYIDARILSSVALLNTSNWKTSVRVISAFDYSWHPDATDEPYIYVFGNTQYPAEVMPTVQYEVSGATEIKYVHDVVATLGVDMTHWLVPKYLDTTAFDFSWHPNPNDPPYIYEFGTQWQKTGGPRYVVPGATEVKYEDFQTAIVLADKKRWVIPKLVSTENFDFSWHPDATDEIHVYEFGTQWQKTGGPKYVPRTADVRTPVKYIDTTLMRGTALPNTNWEIMGDVLIKEFDYSWHPDSTDEPYIYVFGNTQYPGTVMPTMVYTVRGATTMKYITDIAATLAEDKTNWIVPSNIEVSSINFAWKPDPGAPPYIYEFGTQWQKTGGPRYVVPGATETKYVDGLCSKSTPNKEMWFIPEYIDTGAFDFSWHPDATDTPFIYIFGTQWALTGGPRYVVPGATEVKYIDAFLSIAKADKTHWDVPKFIDTTDFDFSWHPYAEDEPYIYQFGTQWQKTGGPRYITPGSDSGSAIKYIDTRILKAKALTNPSNWKTVIPVSNFDYSWHPDSTDEPYIYIFGNTQYPAEVMPTLQYEVAGATELKYVSDIVAVLKSDKTQWETPSKIDISSFDYSWKPDPGAPPYIYEFGTQWQKTGGPRYVVPGATEVKYVDIKVTAMPDKSNWKVIIPVTDFDYSWHPDATEEPYTYVFGNTQYPAEVMPTLQYTVTGATEVKYVNDIVAALRPDKTNWEVPAQIDAQTVNFAWKPDPGAPPYIYEFGTQWQKTGGPRYVVPGATEVKYVDVRLIRLADSTDPNWVRLHVVSEFDYSWHPDSTDEPYIYVFGNTQYPAEVMPTVKYVVPGATEVKYVDSIVAKLADDKKNWMVPANIESGTVDYSWKPDPGAPPYIYEFGTQWQKTGGPRYVAPGATEVKYVDVKATRLADADKSNWKVIIPVTDFDYSWHPDSTEEPYTYVFGNQWNRAELEPTVEYTVPGATIIKYIDLFVATAAPNSQYWEIVEQLESFDYSWRPDPTDPDYIYVFGNTQYPGNIMPTVKYLRPGATQEKFVDTITAKLASRPDLFTNTENISKFNYSWRPNPKDPAYIYQFGTQWAKTHGPMYTVPEATEIKFVTDTISTISPVMANWTIPAGVNTATFDFSWHPDSSAPPYIYQFGTILDENDGPIYTVPGNDGEIVNKVRVEVSADEARISPVVEKYQITTTLDDLIVLHPDEIFWALNPDIDYSKFDFTWLPDIQQAKYVHAFGSQDSINTQTYFVNSRMWNRGHREINYVEDKMIELVTKIDMFFVDRGNLESAARFEQLKARYSNIQKTRYLNSWVDTINRCINRATSNLCWVLNSELSYDNFDFDFYPSPWQMKMVHVFGTQWSHWGSTFMVNKNTFAEDTKYIKIIEHLSNLNFVKRKTAAATNCIYDVVVIDHDNKETEQIVAAIHSKISTKSITTFRYVDSYINTLRELLKTLPVKKEHYLWICSSVCDYSRFDFSYICDPFAREQLHVFPSDKQKFGDTFLVDINKLRTLIDDMLILEDYTKINYNQHQRAKRLPAPIIPVVADTHCKALNIDFQFPYAIFETEKVTCVDHEPMSLWTPESKTVMITSTGGTRIIVPKEAKTFIKKELYDYPYIKRSATLAKSSPLDIVFLSNGETGADENFKHLQALTKGLSNRIVRVDGVNGRVAAYHAAAEASETPWMFTVFAKLKVSHRFDWNWQPDRLQVPKHYIFHATNPVNGLVYGHQACIAYNKKLTLANSGHGLDFTMDDVNEVVEVNSGVANYNTDAWSTWRTAFREVVKLCAEDSEISRKRLHAWLTIGKGDFAEYSLAGAKHAQEYFNEVDGDIFELRLSYDWAWLRGCFDKLYSK